MSYSPFHDNGCILSTEKHFPCIEFVLNQQVRHGFHLSQLLSYRLEANDSGNDAPPEKLVIAFATADVTLAGWRLDHVAELLREGRLLAVRSQPSRYAQLESNKPAVASITIGLLSNVEARHD